MQRFFYALLILLSGAAHAQFNEFGFGVGGSSYTGDINPRFRPADIRPAFTLFYRYNVSKVIALNLNFNAGMIRGSESHSDDPLPERRNTYFNSTYSAVSFLTEYNFINFRDKKTNSRISPYLCGGLALYGTGTNTYGNVMPEDVDADFFKVAIPFGGGVKYRLTKVLNLGWEARAYKTFNDHIDGVSKGIIGSYLTADPNDMDWFYQTMFTLSYTIYGVKCPSDQKYQ
ncbi:MAG: porin family protein [Cytophagaceae bacterium]|jgi:hypothetical protein|nr:porin family protein [Cytophagaceae bacterium]